MKQYAWIIHEKGSEAIGLDGWFFSNAENARRELRSQDYAEQRHLYEVRKVEVKLMTPHN